MENVLDELGAYEEECNIDVRLLSGPSTPSEFYNSIRECFRYISEDQISSLEEWCVDPDKNKRNVETGVAVNLDSGEFSLYIPSKEDIEISPFENF